MKGPFCVIHFVGQVTPPPSGVKPPLLVVDTWQLDLKIAIYFAFSSPTQLKKETQSVALFLRKTVETVNSQDIFHDLHITYDQGCRSWYV